MKDKAPIPAFPLHGCSDSEHLALSGYIPGYLLNEAKSRRFPCPIYGFGDL
jgi:hypothetical protein